MLWPLNYILYYMFSGFTFRNNMSSQSVIILRITVLGSEASSISQSSQFLPVLGVQEREWVNTRIGLVRSGLGSADSPRCKSVWWSGPWMEIGSLDSISSYLWLPSFTQALIFSTSSLREESLSRPVILSLGAHWNQADVGFRLQKGWFCGSGH